jgi:hypothetical protein
LMPMSGNRNRHDKTTSRIIRITHISSAQAWTC